MNSTSITGLTFKEDLLIAVAMSFNELLSYGFIKTVVASTI
jgi:hypothetical protein